MTSFHSSGVSAKRLNGIMTAYLAAERARMFRRLSIVRFGLLAVFVAAIGLGFHRLSPFASWLTVGLCLAVPAWAWGFELLCDRRLTRRLEGVEAAEAQPGHWHQKDIKSS